MPGIKSALSYYNRIMARARGSRPGDGKNECVAGHAGLLLYGLPTRVGSAALTNGSSALEKSGEAERSARVRTGRARTREREEAEANDTPKTDCETLIRRDEKSRARAFRSRLRIRFREHGLFECRECARNEFLSRKR